MTYITNALTLFPIVCLTVSLLMYIANLPVSTQVHGKKHQVCMSVIVMLTFAFYTRSSLTVSLVGGSTLLIISILSADWLCIFCR